MSLKQKTSYSWIPTKEKTAYWHYLQVVTLLSGLFLCTALYVLLQIIVWGHKGGLENKIKE